MYLRVYHKSSANVQIYVVYKRLVLCTFECKVEFSALKCSQELNLLVIIASNDLGEKYILYTLRHNTLINLK